MDELKVGDFINLNPYEVFNLPKRKWWQFWKLKFVDLGGVYEVTYIHNSVIRIADDDQNGS